MSLQKKHWTKFFTTQKADFCFMNIVMYNSMFEKDKIFVEVLTIKCFFFWVFPVSFICSKLIDEMYLF